MISLRLSSRVTWPSHGYKDRKSDKAPQGTDLAGTCQILALVSRPAMDEQRAGHHSRWGIRSCLASSDRRYLYERSAHELA